MGIIELILGWLAANPKLAVLIIAAVFEGFVVAKNWAGEKNKAALIDRAYADMKLKRDGLNIVVQAIENASNILKLKKDSGIDPAMIKNEVAKLAPRQHLIGHEIHMTKLVAEGKLTPNAETVTEWAERLFERASRLSLLNPFKK